MIFVRASESTLKGMKVANESLAMLESACTVSTGVDNAVSIHTRLAYFKELIGIPGYHPSRESTPGPLDHAAQNLVSQ
jgi:hypothetical protein